MNPPKVRHLIAAVVLLVAAWAPPASAAENPTYNGEPCAGCTQPGDPLYGSTHPIPAIPVTNPARDGVPCDGCAGPEDRWVCTTASGRRQGTDERHARDAMAQGMATCEPSPLPEGGDDLSAP